MANLLNNKFMANSYNPLFPGLNKSNYDKVVAYGNSLWLEDEEEKRRAENNYYRKNVNRMVNDQILDERDGVINEQTYQAWRIKSKDADIDLRTTELSQTLKRKYNLDATYNDSKLVDEFIDGLTPEWKALAWKYLAWESDEFLYVSWLAERPKEIEKEEEKEKLEETWWQKAWDFAVWVAQSPWKRGYNIVGQWMDRVGKEIADKLDWTVAQDVILDLAKMTFWEDEVKRFQEEQAKNLEEWTAFNGREATDIRTPILWEERANSWWTKGWEVVWDIASWIALTAPMAAATAPYLASASLWEAASFGALQWLADTALTHYWSQWDLNVTPWEMAMWAVLGWLWWAATNKLSNLSKVDDVTNATNKASKIADKTDDANRIAGRIWQGDIDDQKKVVEWVRSMTSRNGKEQVKNIKKYSQLEDVIKKTEKQIIEQEDNLLKKFPEKIKDWTTTETVKWLWDQTDDVTRDFIDEWIELLKKYNKNDPAALKELDMMQNVKNTEWLTRLEAKNLARKITTRLSKKFYNSNDELRNSMSAESYEKIRKWIQNAVRDRLPDDALKNLDLEYSNLKAFEWLADDMAEKVNTLTQKIKETWPIEKLWRKLWDAINFITGKGIKWLVEKFLPSNMWNKINNSIDMETELAKNLGKLVKLNDAIGELNGTINSSASKAAMSRAINAFTKTVADIQKSITPTALNTATRWAEVISDVVYNN